jgi:hypothetical protein
VTVTPTASLQVQKPPMELPANVQPRAGEPALRRHWPGTPDGLAAQWKAARLPAVSR